MTKIIWTNHAKKRLQDRKLTQNQILETISSPDSKINNSDGSIEIAREYGNQKVHIVIKESEKEELIILSCWINPPNHGSTDLKNKQYNKKVKKASGIKKFWYTLLNQLGF